MIPDIFIACLPWMMNGNQPIFGSSHSFWMEASLWQFFPLMTSILDPQELTSETDVPSLVPENRKISDSSSKRVVSFGSGWRSPKNLFGLSKRILFLSAHFSLSIIRLISGCDTSFPLYANDDVTAVRTSWTWLFLYVLPLHQIISPAIQ